MLVVVYFELHMMALRKETCKEATRNMKDQTIILKINISAIGNFKNLKGKNFCKKSYIFSVHKLLVTLQTTMMKLKLELG